MRHLGVIVQEHDILAPGRPGRLVAVFQEALVGLVAADDQAFHILPKTGRGVRGYVIRNNHLVGHILCEFQDGLEACIGVMHLVITRDYNGYLGSVPTVRAFPARARHLREYEPSIFEVILPYLKIPVNLVAS